MQTITEQSALNASLEYFEGDELAASVFVSKYALRDASGNLLESTPYDMHVRLAKEFSKKENLYKNPISYETILEQLSSWKIVPQGSPMSAVGNPYKFQSLSNCFVIKRPADSYAGIMRTDQEQAQIMKRRGGVGYDISAIRPKNQPTSNAAVTTDGIGIFMERFSNTTREVAQGGRRGALMMTISCKHPEIETFLTIKNDKEKVTGANISVRVDNDFMNAVVDDKNYTQQWPVDADPSKCVIQQEVRAREIWDKMMKCAWQSAEPGILFWDRIKKYSPADFYSYCGFGTESTNPCLSGDTLIAVADGRNAVSLRQLAEEGKDVPVYSTDPSTGKVEIKMGRNPRRTKQNAEVWKLTLDDGSYIIATPDHKIMKRDCTYTALCNLKPGDSLFPFNSFDSNGYRQICNTGAKLQGEGFRNRRQYRLIYENQNAAIVDKTHVIHHADFNSYNDRIENLQKLTHEEHNYIHSESRKGLNNSFYKMTKEKQHFFSKVASSHPGERNGRYSGVTNENLLDQGKMLFNKYGKLTGKIWAEHAKQNKLPIYLGNKFRFGSWQNFVNQVANNHKVVSVEKFGTEDVFNITVDDHHNYHTILSSSDENFIVSSGICVKNCGEIVLSPYDSCRLMAINLEKFVRNSWESNAYFDFHSFWDTVTIAQRLMDDLIDLEIDAIDAILNKIKNDPVDDQEDTETEINLWQKIRVAAVNGRRTGLGITSLGDALARLGIVYGSDKSIEITEDIYKHLAMASYASSIVMASERGAFKVFNKEEIEHPFIKQIIDVLPEYFVNLYKEFGRRNIANTTTAPTGSVSCLTQTTSGIEPVFRVSYTRRKKINANNENQKVDFIDAKGDKWTNYVVYHKGFKEWMQHSGQADVALSPYAGATANEIDWVNSVDLQAVAQKWVCHAISKTCNLPKDTSVSVVNDVYLRAWRSGCKGFTIYRDGCRDGVLVDNDAVAQKQPTENHATKRPKSLPCDIHNISVRTDDVSEKYVVIVGLLDNKPYEVFCGKTDSVSIPGRFNKGVVTKRKKGGVSYDLTIDEGDESEESWQFNNIINLFNNPIHGAFTRILSLMLRHNIPVNYIVEQIAKDTESDMQSFGRAIARVLKKYIPDGTKSTEKSCTECGSKELAFKEGCVTCLSCGNSKCSLFTECQTNS